MLHLRGVVPVRDVLVDDFMGNCSPSARLAACRLLPASRRMQWAHPDAHPSHTSRWSEAWELGLSPPERRTLQQEEEEQSLPLLWTHLLAAARAGIDVGYEGMLEAGHGGHRALREEPAGTTRRRSSARGWRWTSFCEQVARARRPPKGKGREEQGEEEKEGRDEGVKGEARRQRRLQERGRAMPAVPELIAGGGPEAATRMSLPVYSHRAAILEALEAEVSIIEGETGSGKTTQVPQYLLEAAASAGTHVNVICTQPRRISAIGVAERVAAERGETVGEGAVVAAAVRGESRQSEKATARSSARLACCPHAGGGRRRPGQRDSRARGRGA